MGKEDKNKNLEFTSVISNSPLLEGFNFLEYLITLLSKKYNPVIARLDKNFFGFSLIDIILFLLLIFATPYNSGLATLCKNIFAPCLSFVQSRSFFVKFCP